MIVAELGEICFGDDNFSWIFILIFVWEKKIVLEKRLRINSAKNQSLKNMKSP